MQGLRGKAIVGLATLLVLCSGQAVAQLPLTVEDWLVDYRTLRIGLRSSVGTIDAPLAGLQPTASVSRQDLSVRYGISPRLELTAGWSHLRIETSAPSGALRQETLSAGLNLLAVEEGEWPALLLRAGAGSRGASGDGAGSGDRSPFASVGFHLYRSLDPLVLSLSGDASRFDRAASAAEPGDGILQFSLSPQVNFAVNHTVTLSAGLSWHWVQSGGSDLPSVGPGVQQSRLTFGAGIALTPSSTLFVDTALAVTGRDSAQLGVEWIYRFM
jgi:hypothetical protein